MSGLLNEDRGQAIDLVDSEGLDYVGMRHVQQGVVFLPQAFIEGRILGNLKHALLSCGTLNG